MILLGVGGLPLSLPPNRGEEYPLSQDHIVRQWKPRTDTALVLARPLGFKGLAFRVQVFRAQALHG